MENQITNPMEVLERVESGDPEAIKAFTSGQFEHLYTQENTVIPEPIQEPQPMPTEEVAETPEEPVEEVSEEPTIDMDEIQKQRDVYDEQQRQQKMLEAQMAEQLEAFKKQSEQEKQELLKQQEKLAKELEEMRNNQIKNESDEDIVFFDEEPKVSAVETAEVPVEAPSAENEELKALLQWKAEQEAKEKEREVNNFYKDFWMSNQGGEFKPDGSLDKAIDDFKDFFSELIQIEGNENNARRFMLDLSNFGELESHKGKLEKAGISVPDNFNKVFDTYKLGLFSEGYEIDPVTGKKEKKSNSYYSSLEDAYVVMNKDKIAHDNKVEAIKEVQTKIAQKQNSAVQIEPERVASLSPNAKFMDERYVQQVWANALKNGLRGMDVNTIRDQAARNEFAELMTFMK